MKRPLTEFEKETHIRIERKNFIGRVLSLADLRKTDNPQIWIAGCSISHGIGVTNEQRFGQLVANELNLEASFLTQPGSSIEWAADQILRSDIRRKDIVVWGLTHLNRFPVILDYKVENVGPWNLDEHRSKFRTVEGFNEENMIYKALTRTAEVVNFCNKVKARLVLGGLVPAEHKELYYVSNSPHYVTLPDTFVDHGSDKLHPGPKQHREYADIIINKLREK